VHALATYVLLISKGTIFGCIILILVCTKSALCNGCILSKSVLKSKMLVPSLLIIKLLIRFANFLMCSYRTIEQVCVCTALNS